MRGQLHADARVHYSPDVRARLTDLLIARLRVSAQPRLHDQTMRSVVVYFANAAYVKVAGEAKVIPRKSLKRVMGAHPRVREPWPSKKRLTPRLTVNPDRYADSSGAQSLSHRACKRQACGDKALPRGV